MRQHLPQQSRRHQLRRRLKKRTRRQTAIQQTWVPQSLP
jgi:hypothetical protein